MKRYRVHEELCLISQVEPKNLDEACKDDYWIQAMKEELDQIVKNETWELVPKPKDKNVKGTKWILRNKMNEQGEVVRNKERLVSKGYSQQKGIDYEETFSPIAKIKAIRMFFVYVASKKFEVYLMDVNLAFMMKNLKKSTLSNWKDIL